MVDPVLVGGLFYSKLFNENPGIRVLFPKDMTAQNKKLADMLTTIISSINHRDILKKNVDDIILKHVIHHIKPEYYNVAAKSLLWTLEQGLGTDWNTEVKEAWISCYSSLTEMMNDDVRIRF